MSIDFESLKDKAVVAAQEGVTRAREITETGVAKARELADTGIAKAKEIAEIAKLKVNNSTEQEAIRKAYSELGKLYYAERGSAPEAAYADACQRISDSMARISYNNERIADIKAAGQLTDEEVESAEVELIPDESVDETPEESESCGCCCGGEDKEEPVEETPDEDKTEE